MGRSWALCRSRYRSRSRPCHPQPRWRYPPRAPRSGKLAGFEGPAEGHTAGGAMAGPGRGSVSAGEQHRRASGQPRPHGGRNLRVEPALPSPYRAPPHGGPGEPWGFPTAASRTGSGGTLTVGMAPFREDRLGLGDRPGRGTGRPRPPPAIGGNQPETGGDQAGTGGDHSVTVARPQRLAALPSPGRRAQAAGLNRKCDFN